MARKPTATLKISEMDLWDEDGNPKEKPVFPQMPLGGFKYDSRDFPLSEQYPRKPTIPLSRVNEGYRVLVRIIESDYAKIQTEIAEICLKNYQTLLKRREIELRHAKRSRKKDVIYCYLAQRKKQLERHIGQLEKRVEKYKE